MRTKNVKELSPTAKGSVELFECVMRGIAAMALVIGFNQWYTDLVAAYFIVTALGVAVVNFAKANR